MRIRFGFDRSSFLLFLMIMLPNFVWFFFHAPNDILRYADTVPLLEAAQFVLQMILFLALVFICRKPAHRFFWKSPLLWCPVVQIALYYGCWCFYYLGFVHWCLLFGMTLFPCGTFLSYAFLRRNWIAFFAALAFTGFHCANTLIMIIK